MKKNLYIPQKYYVKFLPRLTKKHKEAQKEKKEKSEVLTFTLKICYNTSRLEVPNGAFFCCIKIAQKIAQSK